MKGKGKKGWVFGGIFLLSQPLLQENLPPGEASGDGVQEEFTSSLLCLGGLHPFPCIPQGAGGEEAAGASSVC